MRKILFFSLIPIGIFILIKGIQLIKKTFYGKVLLEIPYLQKIGHFSVTKAGKISINHKGQSFRRTPIDKFTPHIYNEETHQEVKIHYSLIRPRTNDFSSGRMEVYYFYAPVGKYRLELKDEENLLKNEGVIANMTSAKPIDLSKYFIEIRETQSSVITFIAILLITFGGVGIIGGFVLGLLSDQF